MIPVPRSPWQKGLVFVAFTAIVSAGAHYFFHVPTVGKVVDPKRITANHSKKKIATAKSVKGDALLRRNEDFVWEDLRPGVDLYEYDVVQTTGGGNTTLEFENGSETKLSERTTVVISPGLKTSEGISDRAYLSSGQIEARTRTELWLITAAALFELKARSRDEIAAASLSVDEKKHLKITLHQGTGAYLSRRKTPDQTAMPEPMLISVQEMVTVEAPHDMSVDATPSQEVLATNDLAALLGRALQNAPSPTPERSPEVSPSPVPISNPEVTPIPPLTPPPIPPLTPPPIPPPKNSPLAGKAQKPFYQKPVELLVSGPASYSIVRESKIELKGSLSAKGAQLLLNERKVEINKDLSFSTPVSIKKGTNNLIFQIIQPNHESTFVRWILIGR